MTLAWEEAVEGIEPGQASFSTDGGGGKTATYWLTPETPDDLQTAITDILGDTEIEAGDGRLTRALPKAHPQYPWLYAQAISSVKGYGITPQDLPSDLQDANPELECPTLASQYVWYRKYAYTIDFRPRPYAVTSDAEINVYEGAWFDYDGVEQEFTYADEWTRYTYTTVLPAADFITAQQGEMAFVTTGNVKPGGRTYAAAPRMYLPNLQVKMLWQAVPYRYIYSENSILRDAIGTINQNAWNGYGAGDLLFLGFTPTPYTPIVPDLVENATVNGKSIFSTDRLCNLELNFLWTTRQTRAENLPSEPPGGNRNHVIGGHNLLPWLGSRRFYYAVSTGQAEGGLPLNCPSFLSYPHELLFSDPDS